MIQRTNIFDYEAVVFYAAEILLALEHLHKMNIVHRDLKPENILLNEDMHIQISDFGSAWIKNDEEVLPQVNTDHSARGSYRNRKSSFVGTAQYVSPEILSNKVLSPMADLWAYGCIIFQMITNRTPFAGANDYCIFQKIHKLNYEFPIFFPQQARFLVSSLLKIDSTQRLGASDDLNGEGCYASIRSHPFFDSLDNDWDMINKRPPERVCNIARGMPVDDESTSKMEPGLSERQNARLYSMDIYTESMDFPLGGRKKLFDITEFEYTDKLKKQVLLNNYHRFVENNLILKQGILEKRKGLFPRRRMFLLTTGPKLYYVDPANMVLKGQVPIVKSLRTEIKNFRNFLIHVVSCSKQNQNWCANPSLPCSLIAPTFWRIQVTMRQAGVMPLKRLEAL